MALCGTIMLSSGRVAMFRQQVNSCSITLGKKADGLEWPPLLELKFVISLFFLLKTVGAS
jgi:hypothetical protein